MKCPNCSTKMRKLNTRYECPKCCKKFTKRELEIHEEEKYLEEHQEIVDAMKYDRGVNGNY